MGPIQQQQMHVVDQYEHIQCVPAPGRMLIHVSPFGSFWIFLDPFDGWIA